MGGKSQQSTSQVQIPPEVLARYNAVNAQAQQVAQTPFQPYSTDPNAFVAPLTTAQNAGLQQIGEYANSAQPSFDVAQGLTMAGAGAVNPQALNVQAYMNPYMQQVMAPTEQLMQQQFQQAQSQQMGNAMQQGAFGGDRAGIAAANLQQQQALAYGQTMGGLLNQNYQQALGAAQQQQGVNLTAQQANLQRMQAAGAQMGQLGTAAQQAALSGGQAEMAAGQVQQQTNQAGLTALYNQYLQQQSYPFQTAQFLANIAEGTGALSGQTTTSTTPAPFFSDPDLKEDIKEIGKAKNGLPIYSYRYKNDPEKLIRLGFMSDDVEKKEPEAVGLAGGYKTVDYEKALPHATGGSVQDWNQGEAYRRGGFDDGGYAQTGVGGDPGWQGMLSQQEQMYQGAGGSPYAKSGSMTQRGIPNTPSQHHLPAAPAPPHAPPSGLQQVGQLAQDVDKYASIGQHLGQMGGAASQKLGLAGAAPEATKTAPATAAPAAAAAAPPPHDAAPADTGSGTQVGANDTGADTAAPVQVADLGSDADNAAGLGAAVEDIPTLFGNRGGRVGLAAGGDPNTLTDPGEIAANAAFQGFPSNANFDPYKNQALPGSPFYTAPGGGGQNQPAPLQAAQNPSAALAQQVAQGAANQSAGFGSGFQTSSMAPYHLPTDPSLRSQVDFTAQTPAYLSGLAAGQQRTLDEQAKQDARAAANANNFYFNPDLSPRGIALQNAGLLGSMSAYPGSANAYLQGMAMEGISPQGGYGYAAGGRAHFDAGGAGSSNSSGATDAGDPEGLYASDQGMDIPNQPSNAKLPEAPKPPQQSGGGDALGGIGKVAGMLMPLFGLALGGAAPPRRRRQDGGVSPGVAADVPIPDPPQPDTSWAGALDDEPAPRDTSWAGDLDSGVTSRPAPRDASWTGGLGPGAAPKLTLAPALAPRDTSWAGGLGAAEPDYSRPVSGPDEIPQGAAEKSIGRDFVTSPGPGINLTPNRGQWSQPASAGAAQPMTPRPRPQTGMPPPGGVPGLAIAGAPAGVERQIDRNYPPAFGGGLGQAAQNVARRAQGAAGTVSRGVTQAGAGLASGLSQGQSAISGLAGKVAGGVEDWWPFLTHQESGGRQFNASGQVITSPKGAFGIAQLMPDTAQEVMQRYGLHGDPVHDPAFNEYLGKLYLSEQLQRFGSMDKALAAYNGGPARTAKMIAKYGDNWLSYMPHETQNYVTSIFARHQRAGDTQTAGAGLAPAASVAPAAPNAFPAAAPAAGPAYNADEIRRRREAANDTSYREGLAPAKLSATGSARGGKVSRKG